MGRRSAEPNAPGGGLETFPVTFPNGRGCPDEMTTDDAEFVQMFARSSHAHCTGSRDGSLHLFGTIACGSFNVMQRALHSWGFPRDHRRPDIRRDSGEPPRGPTPAGPVPSPRSDAPEGGLPAQREPPSPNDRGQSVATRRAVARKPRASACGPTKIRPGLSRVAGTAGFPSVQTRESREVGNPLQAARTRLTYNLVSGRFS